MKSIKMLMMAAITILSVSVFAQDTTKQKVDKITYSCPMHPDVVMDKSGKCPKCGRDLTKSPKEQMKMEVMKKYTCPAHADVTSNESGKCPKCGTLLKLSPKEQMKMKEMKMFTCPMHPEIKSDKPGECPICGMTLVKKEISSSDTIGSHQITDTTSVN